MLNIFKRHGRKRVLIVDDDASLRTALEALFETKGYEVIQAGNGEEGLEKAKSAHPDIIILDVLMPGKSGLTVASELKDDPKYCSIPIVMLTAIDKKSGKSEEFWREKSPADAFIAKPFDYMELIRIVEEILDKKET